MVERALTLASPAKLNIDLRILGVRKDGMHEIDSVMTLLDFCDRVTVRTREDEKIIRRWSHREVKNDLCVRASHLLQQEAGVKKGVEIEVHKQIPVGGGLGGGSSNAAAVLWMLNQLWDINWGRRKLMKLGSLLGADVPFFLFGRAAHARGNGSELTPARNAYIRRYSHYLLTFPKVLSRTSEAYCEYEKLQKAKKMKSRDTKRDKLVDNSNDLAEAVFRLHPGVSEAAEILRKASGEARLSGSGACIYAAFESRETAEEVRTKLPKKLSSVVASSLEKLHVFGE